MSFSARVMYKKLSFLHAHLFDIILVTTIPSTSSATAQYILLDDGMEVRVKNLHTTSTAAAQYILVACGMEVPC